MRIKKVRGHKRRWRAIDRWVETHKDLDLESLRRNRRDYAKILIHPWSGLSLTNSKIPEPARKTKTRLLRGLFEIYGSWKAELDKLEEPYYLKIWLLEPRFSNSQVVCAIGDCLDFYENAFYKPDKPKELRLENYGDLRDEMAKFQWDYRLDEDHFDNTELGELTMYSTPEDYLGHKKWFENLLRRPHRVTKFDRPIGRATKSYSFSKGAAWIGEKQ